MPQIYDYIVYSSFFDVWQIISGLSWMVLYDNGGSCEIIGLPRIAIEMPLGISNYIPRYNDTINSQFCFATVPPKIILNHQDNAPAIFIATQIVRNFPIEIN